MFNNVRRETGEDEMVRVWAITEAFEIKGSRLGSGSPRGDGLMGELVKGMPVNKAQIGNIQFRNLSEQLGQSGVGVHAIPMQVPPEEVAKLQRHHAEAGRFIIAQGDQFAEVIGRDEVLGFIRKPGASAPAAG